jgi:hypothetical protein
MSQNDNSPVNVTKPVFVQANGQYFKVSVNKTTAEEAAKDTYISPTLQAVGVTSEGGRRNKRKGTRRNKRKGTRRNKRKGTRRNKRKGTRRNKRN